MHVYDAVEFAPSAINMKLTALILAQPGKNSYLSCRKVAIFPRMSVSVTPSRESSNPGVSTNNTEAPESGSMYEYVWTSKVSELISWPMIILSSPVTCLMNCVVGM